MKHKHFRRFLPPLTLLLVLLAFLLPSKALIFAQGRDVLTAQADEDSGANLIYLPVVLGGTNSSVAQDRWAGTLSDEDGEPLAGTVTINGVQGEASADGSFELFVPKADDERYVINAEVFGYVPVSQIHVGTASEAMNLMLKQAEQFEIDPSQLAEVEDALGTRISLPAGSLVDADGNPATGPLQVLMYTYDLTQEDMPGDMSALDRNGLPLALESAGVFYADFMDEEGNEYNLAPDAQAEVSIPVDQSAQWPTIIPLWSYDETDGLWKEEGQATQVNGRFVGSVSHFSVWNFDVEKRDPACIKLTVDPEFLANNSPIQIKAVLLSPTRVRYLYVTQATNVLINLPANTNVEFYMPPSSPIPFATINTGAPWGGTGYPPRPYDDCDGMLHIEEPEASALSGMKFNDLNGNGVKDLGEPGLEGWTISLTDANGNVITTTTDADGNYQFTNLPPGTALVSEVQQSGWIQTYPSTIKHTVALASGQELENIDFGNTESCENPTTNDCIAGRTDDFDRSDGTESSSPSQDLLDWAKKRRAKVLSEFDVIKYKRYFLHTFGESDTDTCLSGECLALEATLTIKLKAGRNRRLTSNDTIGFVQDGDVIWSSRISSLVGRPWTPGSMATITLDLANLPSYRGVTNVLANLRDGKFDLYVQDHTGVDSIELEIQRCEEAIHGMKFNDLDGDGEKDADEPGLEGWEITLTDASGSILTTTTDVDGNYSFTPLAAGTYTVAEVQQDGWTQTFPSAPGTHMIQLEAGQVLENIDFGNQQDEPGEIYGMKFNDLDGDGEKDAGEPGLEGWEITLTDASGSMLTATTDVDGNYSFTPLAAGTYTVTEVQQDGWTQTFPSAPGTHMIELEAGQVLENIDFGNQQDEPGEIYGMKFNDLDGDGEKDASEPGLEGWEITLTDASGSMLTATTDVDGNYSFTPLAAGTYTVTEVQQDGWTQTFPSAPGTHMIELEAGQVLENIDFGNQQDEQCDLSIQKEHEGNTFIYGESGIYNLMISNNGEGTCEGPIVMADRLPTGMSVPPGTFTIGGWGCNADVLNPQAIVCSYLDPLPANSSLPLISLTVEVPDASSAGGAGWNGDIAKNCGIVGGPNDSTSQNNESCDEVTVVAPAPPSR